MKKHITSKKGFFALTLCASFAQPMLILSAASSSSCAIEPQEEITRTELQQRLTTLQALQIDPFLAQRKPKSLAEIAHGFAQRTLQEYEYAALNRKYLLPKEEPAKCMEGITGRFSLRYKIIGKLFQEYQEDKLSFEDLFAIAQHQNSLVQLASFVYFAIHKETTWDDETIRIGNRYFGPWERKMQDYPKELIPYLGIALEEYIAYNKAPSINDKIPLVGNILVLDEGNLTSLAGIEAIPGIESVVSLYLESNKISTFPDSISSFTELRYLYLWRNQFTTLPYSISNLTKLKHLNLSCNKLTALADSVGNLTQLVSLHLFNNQLTALPDSVCNLTNLKELVLGNNNFSETERNRIILMINQATAGQCKISW